MNNDYLRLKVNHGKVEKHKDSEIWKRLESNMVKKKKKKKVGLKGTCFKRKQKERKIIKFLISKIKKKKTLKGDLLNSLKLFMYSADIIVN